MTDNSPVMANDRARSAVASRFVAARRTTDPLGGFPGPVPKTLAEGYAIQARAIELRGGAIGGWKIGRIADALVGAAGADRLAGPIFADRIVHAAGETATMPIIARGFAAVEAEFLLRLGAVDLSPSAVRSLSDARDVVDRVAVGIEIASSPLPTINDLGPAVTISDFGNNNGLLIGPQLDAARIRSLDTVDVRVSIDGALVGQGTTATMLDGPFGAVRFLLALAARFDLPVAPGQWISTGAVTGVHPIVTGARAVARFDELAVTARIVAEQPQDGEDRHAGR